MKFVATLLVLITTTAVMAGAKAHADGATVIVYGSEIATFKTGTSDFTPEKRAKAAANVIQSAFDLPVAVIEGENSFRIQLGDLKVMTVTATEARAHGLSVKAYANEVGSKLKSALAAMPFDISRRQIWLPPDGSAEIEVIGIGAGKLKLERSGDSFRISQTDTRLIVSASSVGKSVLTINYGDYSETVPINVLAYAAEIENDISATVTGRPADKGTVTAAAMRSVHAAIKPEKDAKIEIVPISTPSLVPSQKGKAKFLATISAPGFYPVKKELTVDLKNIGMTGAIEGALWYSNYPENVKEPGRLYWGRLERDKPVRLLFHHINVSQRAMRFRYLLVNSTDEIAKVSVLMSEAPAHANPTYIGYLAGQSFFKRWSRQSSAIIEIPPHSSTPIIWQEASPNLTVSGLATLRTVDGAVTLIADADWSTGADIEKGNFAHELGATSLADEPINLTGTTRHVYGPTTKDISVEYIFGGRFGFVRIGQEPIERLDQEGKLEGNFGVVYQIKAKITNPTDEEQEIEIVYESSAGYGGAIFDINGILSSTPMLQPKQSHQLLTIKLKPGETKHLHLNTIPLSGGSYPVTMTIKPTGLG